MSGILHNLTLLAIINGAFGILCLTFQIILCFYDTVVFVASIGAGLWAALIFLGTAVTVLILNKKGGSGWLFGLTLILTGISALTGLQLLVLNISRFISHRGLVKFTCFHYLTDPLKCQALPAGIITSYVFLAIFGALAAPLNVFTCLILIKTFIGSMDFNKPTPSAGTLYSRVSLGAHSQVAGSQPA